MEKWPKDSRLLFRVRNVWKLLIKKYGIYVELTAVLLPFVCAFIWFIWCFKTGKAQECWSKEPYRPEGKFDTIQFSWLIWNSEYESDSNAPIETIVDIEEISGDTYESQSEEKEFDSNDTARNISDIE